MSAGSGRISVVLPVRNGERFIGEAIDSVLGESHPDLELIVVDDGSTDRSADVADAHGESVQVVRGDWSSPALARNRGLEQATGEIIGFIDADDLWVEGRLARQLDLFAENPRAQIISGRTRLLHDPSGGGPRRLGGETPATFVHLGASLLRATAFDRVGSFTAGLRFGEDVDWFLRAREQGLIRVTHDDWVLHYRRHGANMTVDMAGQEADLTRLVKRRLDRLREGGPSVDSIDDWRLTEVRPPAGGATASGVDP